MASEIRVNQIQNRTGLSTVSFTDTGPVISGVTTVSGALTVAGGITADLTGDVTGNLSGNVTGNLTGNVTGDVTGDVTGNVNAGVITATSSIVVGDKFINSSGVGIGTTDTTGRNAGVGTAVGTLIYNTTTNQVEAYGPEGWVNVKTLVQAGLSATGGITNEYTDTSSGNIYRAHVFTSSGSFEVTSLSNGLSDTIDVLAVGGGGGGSGSIQTYWAGSGGGAGGMLEVTSYPVSIRTYSVEIGGGGSGSLKQTTWTLRGSTGSDTSFNNPADTNLNIIAKGGGGGGGSGTPTYIPLDEVRNNVGGGSPGGVGSYPGLSPTSAPAVVTHPNNPTIDALPGVTLTHYGNLGGAGDNTSTGEASGGGGAGGAGTSSDSPFSTTQNKPGGLGAPNVYLYGPASPITYAAGGGGGPSFSKGGAAGGLDGTNSTGNGGSGGSNPTSAEPGGSGGSGVVVVRYQIGTVEKGTAKATGGAISFSGGQTIHQFLSS